MKKMLNRGIVLHVRQLGRGAGLGVCLIALWASASQGADDLRDYESLPDWSGVWSMVGGTVFDRATWTGGGGATTVGSRAHPPYNEEWEAVYSRHVELKDQFRFPDPVTRCGTPVGFPRIFNTPGPIEFVVRPEQVWFLTENTSNVMRVYTDGREHPEPIWATYTGHSVGRWDGDTLVFTTVGLKGWSDQDVILDRSGLVLSDSMHATTRIQQVDEETLEVEMTLEDPQALTEPWVVTKEFRKMEEGTTIFDHTCSENNRNVVSEDGETLFIGPDGRVYGRQQ